MASPREREIPLAEAEAEAEAVPSTTNFSPTINYTLWYHPPKSAFGDRTFILWEMMCVYFRLCFR